VKEADPDNLRQTAARKRVKGPSWRSRLFAQPPLEGGSRKWLWGVGGVALLLLMTFVSGVRVGRELSGPVPRKEAAVSPEEKPGQKIPIQTAEPARDPPPREAEAKAKPGAAPPPEKTKAREPAEARAREKARPAEKDPGTASKAPAPPKVRYTLQIAALNNAEEARELVNKLKGRGYDAYAVTGTAAAKGTLHRVRLGSFPSLQDARQFAVEFEKKEKIKTIIVSP
jgi:cell division septation protein DedD